MCAQTAGRTLITVVALLAFSPNANAQGTETIAVGDAPIALAVDHRDGLVLVVNVRGNSISVIDVRSRQVIRTVAVGELPHRVAVNEQTGRAYVTDWGSDTVSIFEPASDVPARAITVGDGRMGPLEV